MSRNPALPAWSDCWLSHVVVCVERLCLSHKMGSSLHSAFSSVIKVLRVCLKCVRPLVLSPPGVNILVFFYVSFSLLCCCSVTKSYSHSLWPHGLQHARFPCPSPPPRACSNSCPLSRWHHPAISSSVIPFSCLPSFPASGSFLMSQLFLSGGQSIGASASASVFPMNVKG